MPSPTENPSINELSTLLNDIGVNMIPLDIDAEDEQLIKEMSEEWDSDTLRQKPAALRTI
jgi:hypothetical protein